MTDSCDRCYTTIRNGEPCGGFPDVLCMSCLGLLYPQEKPSTGRGPRFAYVRMKQRLAGGPHVIHLVVDRLVLGRPPVEVATFVCEADALAYVEWRNNWPTTSRRSGSNPPPSTPRPAPPPNPPSPPSWSSWGEYQTAYPGS